MAEHATRVALDLRWRRMLASGHLSDIGTEVDTALHSANEQDTAFLLNWRATILNQLGVPLQALEATREALMACENLDEPKIEAQIHSNIALASMCVNEVDQAGRSFQLAERLLRELGEDWALGAVLVNHATLELTQRGQIQAGLALLEEAKRYQPSSEADRVQESHRMMIIRINRSAALRQLGETQESIDELLIAHREVSPSGNRGLLAIVDFNLSQIYESLRLYGSMLEAAESACRAYADASDEVGARRSRALVASAMAHLGKHKQAQDMIDELLSTLGDGPEDDQVRADLVLATHALGWPRDQRDGLLRRQTPAYADREAIFDRLSELEDQGFGDPAAYAESEELLSRLDAFDDLGTRLQTDFVRAVRDAYAGSERVGLSSPKLRRLENIFGPQIGRRIQAVVRGFAGFSSGSLTAQADAWLEVLWHFHATWHDQHDEQYRGDFLTGTGSQHLKTAMDLAVDTARPDTIMELIETFRIDISNLGSSAIPFGLVDFRQLSQAAPVEGTESGDFRANLSGVQRLAAPSPIAIRGSSAMANAASVRQEPIDLEELRVTQAGPEALWWSFAILDQTLYWALLTPNSVHGGKVQIPAMFHETVSTHLATLPTIIPSDIAVLDDSDDPLLARLVALARCTSTRMLDRPEIQASAVAALPIHLRRSVQSYCRKIAEIDVQAAYEQLARILLPEELRQALLSIGPEGRLIVTAPPELATCPIGLLPLDRDSAVLDHASVQFAPPAGLASKLVRRLGTEASRPHLLSIVDTIGDLASAASRTPAKLTVTGWPLASSLADVANRDRLEAVLRDGGWTPGAPGVISYIGHMMPGDRDRPGSAALVCAPATEQERPGLLSARDILSWEQCLPSHIYLGGCEGTGFGTGLEWASVAAAALARGASCVLSHAWPIVDCADMAQIDSFCVGLLTTAQDVAQELANAQRSWLDEWRRGSPDALPPHFWAGLQMVGCA